MKYIILYDNLQNNLKLFQYFHENRGNMEQTRDLLKEMWAGVI